MQTECFTIFAAAVVNVKVKLICLSTRVCWCMGVSNVVSCTLYSRL